MRLIKIGGFFFLSNEIISLVQVGNLFILSLASADLIVGCFVMPLAGIYAIMEEWKMGKNYFHCFEFSMISHAIELDIEISFDDYKEKKIDAFK